MNLRLRRLAAVSLCSLAAPGLAAASERSTAVLDTLAKNTAALHDYSVSVDAHESDGARTDDRKMRFWYRAPDHAKLEVVEGQAAGTRLIWSGGDKVHVRGGIFSFLPVWLDLHDSRIVSLRGNTMLRAEFAPALDCFTAHRSMVTESPGPRIDGQATEQIVLEMPGGLHCPADSSADSVVTKDVLTVVKASLTVRRRERYSGDALVERWNLSDVKLDAGLSDADFR